MPIDNLHATEQELLSPQLEILSRKHTAYLGRLAIGPENLGINDPLTHLYQYLESGNSALVGIKEDVETDIAERLPKAPFVNYVGFEFTGQDFVSLKDKVSMDLMTKTNLKIFEAEATSNRMLFEELIRAKTEAQETQKLAEWFKYAPKGAYLVFESLPIGRQKFAISRIYQKVNDNLLEGCFVSLYNPNVCHFNELRKELGSDTNNCKTEIDLLQNCYEFYTPELILPDKFIDYYVGIYDRILQKQNNIKHSFGLDNNNLKAHKNGLNTVRSQPSLTDIYLDTIKTLANSQGLITPELVQINNKLGMGLNIIKNQAISLELAQNIMKEVILGITSVIDKADENLLVDLKDSGTSQEASYSAISHFGNQAKNTGEIYASNGCPEYSRKSPSVLDSNQDSEYGVLSKVFNTKQTPNNFGKPKIGVCRIFNCPSRGNISWWPDKTLVGGCDICVCCHKLFEKGKSPESVHKINKHKASQDTQNKQTTF